MYPTAGWETNAWDTATSLAEEVPPISDIICYTFLLAFSFIRAPRMTAFVRDVIDMAQKTPEFSSRYQVLALVLWLTFCILVTSRYLYFTLAFTLCTGYSIIAMAWAFFNVLMSVFMAWYLELYTQVVILLNFRIHHLKETMKDVLNPGQSSWTSLKPMTIEQMIVQYRRMSQLVSRFTSIMSPVLFLHVITFFINMTCGLHTLTVNILPMGAANLNMIGIEITYLLSYFMLILMVCWASSSLRDQVSFC